MVLIVSSNIIDITIFVTLYNRIKMTTGEEHHMIILVIYSNNKRVKYVT